MTIFQIKRLAWTTAAAMGIGAITALTAAIMISYDLDEPPVETTAVSQAKPTPPTPRLTLADYEPYLDTGLRRPLPKPPPPPPLAPPPIVQAAEAGLNLLGTINETGNDYAVFRTSEGIELKRVGDSISGATVVEITEGIVRVNRSGSQPAIVRVPLPGSP